MMWLVLAGILLLLFFAWNSYSKQKTTGLEDEPQVYLRGDDDFPDSDSDMQEQYAYRNSHHHEEKDEKDKV